MFFLRFFIFSFVLANQVDAGQIREYWVSAEKVVWDYAPTNKNLIIPEKGLGPWGKTTRYEKYRYFAYSDDTYTRKIEQAEWMGILGPQLIGEVGDTFKVHFKNMADRPLSMHPHGLRYDEDNDGADLRGAGGIIQPGHSYTYTWHLDEKSGPGPADPSSIVWVYHSHVKPVEEVYAGLIGTIVVTAKGMARSPQDPRPKDVDRSFTTMFMVFDEEDGEEGGLMHAMNGYIFGNLQGIEADEGDKIRWHLVGMGSEVDLHTAHWHGETVLNGGRRTDVIDLMPSTMTSVTMDTSNPGTWLYHCHVADHITAGMITRWKIRPKAEP
ncbi:MAG: copper oxidase [Gammaproteobacteria bacterium]|nr:MAG: copper oxidase [Gammaproteobacteria bacterium]